MTDYVERLDNPVQMHDIDEELHQRAPRCSICQQGFLPQEMKVHDHCHICGKYRGAAHNACNIDYQLKREIVVVLHNLRRYDSHLIMQAIGDVCNEMELRLDCVARGMEDYLSFTVRSPRRAETGDDDEGNVEKSWCIKFMDSCLFLPSSLENLVKSNPRDKFCAVNEVFGEDTSMLLRKGVFPYDYFDSAAKLDDERLPPMESFYSRLTNEYISTTDYEFAQNVWEHFQMRTFRDYHNLYLMLDVLLLADVFTEFRRVSLLNYTLDLANYVNLPSLAWDACLKITEVKLQSIYDPDMYTFFEKGKRGGVAVISHRSAEADNPYLPETYDREKPNSHIIYVDANNLYGWAMVRHLPTGDFSWMTEEEISAISDWESHPDDSNTGYTLEVDLDYPEELHDVHNSYPLAPDNLIISSHMLSPYAQSLIEELGLDNSRVRKLAPNLHPKRKYILHYQNLKLYLRLGMKLLKVRRAIKYRQEPWMKPYIELNTLLRSRAKNDFEKDFFKLMNNAVFGKSIENVRKYIDLKLATKVEQFVKLAVNPRYKRSSIFDDELVGVCMRKKTMCLDKPIYVGVSVLDMSKILMYEYHYDYMFPTYGDKATLLFTDTDSLAYHVQTTNIYKDMSDAHYLFDTSEYPTDHPLFSTINKKVLGKFKDETKWTSIQSFVGLRAKMYSFLCAGEDKKRVKGVKKSVVKMEISHEDYRTALTNRQRFRHSMSKFRSIQHQIYSVTQRKASLSPYDDKRYILDDGIATLAYGHYNIPSEPIDALISGLDDYLWNNV